MSYTKSVHKQTGFQTDPYDGHRYLAGSLTRNWNTQPKPYHAPLQFELTKWYVASYETNSPFGFNFYPSENDALVNNSTWDSVKNRAYGKMVDQVGNQSQWANNLIEAHDSIGMIASRALQLARVASELRKGHFGNVLSALGRPGDKSLNTKLKKAKSFGDQWLELHFGWVPAVQDIGNSLKTLSKTDFGTRRVRSSNTMNFRDSASTHGPGDGQLSSWSRDVTMSVRMQANVRVSNSNAYLANQFGVANPLSVAWEAVPYSFVVDWFSNVGQCINAMTDFVGLSMEQGFTTSFQRANYQTFSQNKNNVSPFSPPYIFHNSSSNGIYVRRDMGITGPTLKLTPFKGMSLVRGATAVALLLQKL